MMKYFFVIAIFLLSVTAASAQVLNGTFDKFTGDIPNDWTVTSYGTSIQLKDTLTGNPYVKVHVPYITTDGYNVILLSDTTAAHPYGAVLDPKVKKLTFRYKMSSISLGNVTKVTYLLRDNTGFIYETNQQMLLSAAWYSVEVDIINKHRGDLSGPNYIEIRFTSLTVGIPTGREASPTEFNFHLDDVVLDTNASLAVSKLTPTTNSLLITPNPASSQTRIIRNLQNAEPLTTMIYDITGVLVKRIHSSEDNNSGVIVGTSDLPNGVYYVRSIVGNSVLSQKLVIAH